MLVMGWFKKTQKEEDHFLRTLYFHFPKRFIHELDTNHIASIDAPRWDQFAVLADKRLNETHEGYIQHEGKNLLMPTEGSEEWQRQYEEFCALSTKARVELIERFKGEHAPVDGPPKLGRIERLPDLATPRMYHLAQNLRDGRVLVAGGIQSEYAALASAEIWQPGDATWSKAPPMATARSGGFSSVGLHDGRVLVIGGRGHNPDGVVKACELFDPKRGAWCPTESLGVGRRSHATVVLDDGRVMVAGGHNGSGGATAGRLHGELRDTEIWDPASGTWSVAEPMKATRSGHHICLLQDGSVVVAGGHPMNTEAIKTAEIWNPKTEGWTPIKNWKVRSRSILGLVPQGEVLAVVESKSIQSWNPSTSYWSSSVDLPHQYEGSATLLSDGRILILGGFWQDPDEAEDRKYPLLLENNAKEITQIGIPDVSNKGSRTLAMAGGALMIIGGSAGGRVPTGSAEVWCWRPS